MLFGVKTKSGYEITCLRVYWQIHATFICFDYCWIVLVFICFVFVDAVVFVGVGRHFVPLPAVQCQHFLLVLVACLVVL